MNNENKQKQEDLVANMPQIPKEMVSESKKTMGATVNIFDLNLEDLIFEKMFLMFQKLNPAKKNLLLTKNDLADKRNELLRTVDFKDVLGITTKPTKDDKEAVIAPMLSEIKTDILNLEDAITFYNDKLVIINDLIRFRRIELKIEATLNGDD